jgi:hypothetical protein
MSINFRLVFSLSLFSQRQLRRLLTCRPKWSPFRWTQRKEVRRAVVCCLEFLAPALVLETIVVVVARCRRCSPFDEPHLFLSLFCVTPGAKFLRKRTVFGNGIPTLYQDRSLAECTAFLRAVQGEDNKTLLMFAVPGSGKTRTVREAAAATGAVLHREKLMETHELITALKTCACSKQCPAGYDDAKTLFAGYDDAKTLFAETCKTFLETKVAVLLRDHKTATIALHIDEAQLLMGTTLVDRKNTTLSTNLYDYAMPAFCDAINLISSTRPKLKVFLTGTNFFTPLVLNTGSHLKTVDVQLVGNLPIEFVNQVLDEHFRLGLLSPRLRATHLLDLSANRRAVEHLLSRLDLHLATVEENKGVEASFVLAAAEAYQDWSKPIVRSLSSRASFAAVSTLALLTFPESVGGRPGKCKHVDIVRVPLDRLPTDVKLFALAGGLNLWVQGEEALLQQPEGCVRRLLSTVCRGQADTFSIQQAKVFIEASRSVHTDKGHAFERMFALELTLLDSKMFQAFDKHGLGLAPDSQAVCRAFQYEPRIHVVDWDMPEFEHRVMCVEEDSKATGQRKVDVGFPMFDPSGATWKVFCELKFVANTNTLWRQCYEFFQEMKAIGVGDRGDRTIAAFVSFHDFQSHQPQHATVKTGRSAHDSKQSVEAMMAAHPSKFIILEVAELKTVLPLLSLPQLVSSCLSFCDDLPVSAVSNAIAKLYVSPSPAKRSGLFV